MLVKRLLLIVISLVAGFVLTYAIVVAPFIADTNLEEFGFSYTFFTTLSLGIAVGIWLDKFMGTDILPK
ncbi:MAG: hypothetical protein DWQ04_05000 [Chloroflexi bacterium]|nr:MAG: hypothetical protein DWQ04_05000 [Chloroflexota bacterium]